MYLFISNVSRSFVYASGILVLLCLITGCGETRLLVRDNIFDSAPWAVLRMPAQAKNSLTIDNVAVSANPINCGDDRLVYILKKQFTGDAPIATFKRYGVQFSMYSLKKNNLVIDYEKVVPILCTEGAIPIFEVSITNKTDHVIDLKGTVIAFIPSGDNPVFPSGSTGLGIDQLGGASGTQIEPSASDEDPRAKIQQAIKALNWAPLNEHIRILPTYSFTGFVIFGYHLIQSKGNTAEFQIFDLITEVDDAGKPKKKATFSFKFDLVKGNASAIGAVTPRIRDLRSISFDQAMQLHEEEERKYWEQRGEPSNQGLAPEEDSTKVIEEDEAADEDLP